MPFQKIAMGLAVSTILALGGGVACAQTVSLKLSHFVPPQHAFHKWVVDWTKKLETESGGKLKFQIYPNGQIVGPPNRQFDAARNGIVDIAFCLHGVTPGRYPMTEVANLPYTWPGKTPDIVEMARRMTELAPKYLAKEHTGLHILFMSMANPVVLYSKTAINSVADFKGKKIRYASITNKQLLEAAGATPMLIPPPDAQDALAKGIAEGATFPHEAGLAYDLASVVKYAIEPPMASATFALVMNPAKYNALPADLRAILDKASGVAGAVSFGTAWKAQEEFARNLETSKKGLQIVTLPDAELAKLKAFGQKITTDNIDALEKKGQPARAFYDAYMK